MRLGPREQPESHSTELLSFFTAAAVLSLSCPFISKSLLKKRKQEGGKKRGSIKPKE